MLTFIFLFISFVLFRIPDIHFFILTLISIQYAYIIVIFCVGTGCRHWYDDFVAHDNLNYLLRFLNMIFYPYRAKIPNAFWEPEISLLVCTKNEELLITRLLDSIVAQDYPKEKLEVLVIDESDQDSTPQIVRAYSKQHPYIKLLNRFELPSRPEGYNSVSYGLTLGIERAKGEVIVITEADCILPPSYLHYIISPLMDPTTGSVSSMYVIYGPALTADLLRLDMAGLLWLGLAGFNVATPFVKSLKVKAPGICWGGSTAIRKSTFIKIGGWKGLEKEHAHDLFLGRRITDHGYSSIYAFDRRVKIKNYYTTNPIKQRIRWYKSGMHILRKSPGVIISMFTIMALPMGLGITHSLFIMLSGLALLNIPPFAQIATLYGLFDLNDLFWAAINSLILLLTHYGMAIFSCITPNLYGNYKTKKSAILLFPFWFFFQGIIFIIAGFTRKIKWK